MGEEYQIPTFPSKRVYCGCMGSKKRYACPSHLQSQSLVGDLGGVSGVDGHRSGKLDKRGKLNVHVNTCSIHFGANSCVCVCLCGFLCVLLRPW